MGIISRYVLDTNTVLYLLGGYVAEALPDGEYYIYVITEIELLAYPGLTSEEEARINAFLHDIAAIEFPAQVKTHTINLRKHHNLKLPDAITAATALAMNAVLLTNDQKLLTLKVVPAQSIALNTR